jgi:dihydrolipoamide dehydrogenase
MSSTHYDLIVIGAGPGGYVAAIRAAHHGLRTAIIEKDAALGGTCLLRGCIPTKSLLHSADIVGEVEQGKKLGLIKGEYSIDFAGAQKARKNAVKKGAAGVSYLMKKNKIDVHRGVGSFIDAHTIALTQDAKTTELKAKSVILATGSVPTRLPSIDIDGEKFLTSDEILELKQVPGSLLILGAGAVGMEFASIYSRFGTKCTVVEMLEHPLPHEDTDISIEFAKIVKSKGIDLRTSTKLEHAEVKKGKVVAHLSSAQGASSLKVDMCLVAVGRRPVTEGLNLETLDLKTERGFIPVNGFMQTEIPHIYAIGDIVPTPALAHIASAEALVAVDHLAKLDPQPLNYLQNPSCTYSDPEVASVGLSEKAAQERGYTVKIGQFPFAASGKARIMGHTQGFVKIVSDAQYDEVLGVHIVGPRATDLIAEACVALRTECTTEELAHTIHAHPTLPEVLLEAAHSALGRPLHL